MDLSKLPKTLSKSKRRVGRGESSGTGKTSGRGAKGQKKRGKVAFGFEGGQLPMYKRLPQKKGLGNTPRVKAFSITTDQINKLAGNVLINEENLRKAGLVPKGKGPIKIKIVAKNAVEKAFKVSLPATKKAKILIEKAGGSFKV